MNETNQLIEKRFKKGQIICKAGEFEMCMYNILLGSASVYFDYDTADKTQVEELREGDFINVISFLEARPRKSTVVAQETTVVTVITAENFSDFFKTRSAKIMQLLQGMSARLRHLTSDYLKVCEELERKPETQDDLKCDDALWRSEQESTYQTIARMVNQRD